MKCLLSTVIFLDLALTIVALRIDVDGLTEFIDNNINSYLSLGDQYGMIGNAVGVVEAKIKIDRGDSDGEGEFARGLAKIAITDLGKMMAESFEKQVAVRHLAKTKRALLETNHNLLAEARGVVSTASTKDWDNLEKGIENSIRKSRVDKDFVIDELKKDLIDMKTRTPRAYKTFKSQTKWLRNGGKALKFAGPLIDVVSIGFDAYEVHHAEPGSNACIAGWLGIASSICGIVGFFAGLVTPFFPPAGLVAAGFTAASYGLSIASTTVGLIGDEDDPPPPPPPDIRYGNPQGIKIYNSKIKETMDSTIGHFNKAKYTKWDSFYMMSEANLIDWAEQTSSSSPKIGISLDSSTVKDSYPHKSQGDNNVIFGNTDPHDTSMSQNNLNCLPYKNQLLVNGFLRSTTNYAPYSSSDCSDSRHRNSLGFDFIGIKNSNTENLDNPNEYRGLLISCLTDNIKNNRLKYIGAIIDTQSEDFPTSHKDKDDIVVLGDFKGLLPNKKVTVRTYGGFDTLSITGFMGLKTRNLVQRDYSTPFLDADLGAGFNLLSFNALSKDMTITEQHDERKFIGIKFEVATMQLFYQYQERVIKNRQILGFVGPVIDQYIGHVRGTNSINACPFKNFIILSANKDNRERQTKGVEDFSVQTTVGNTNYKITIYDDNTECNGYIRRFLLYDESDNKPIIHVFGADNEEFRIVFRRSRQLRLYCYNSGRYRLFAMITLLGFPNSFSLEYNGVEIDPFDLGSIFTDRKAQSLQIDGNGDNLLFSSTGNDQVILKCRSESELTSSTTVLNMAGGSNTVVIGREFFMGCGIEPASYEGDLSETLGVDDDTVPSSVRVIYNRATYRHDLIIERGSVTKTVSIAYGTRIVDDIGNTVVKLLLDTDERDLLKKIWDVFGYAVQAFQSSLFFGRTSQLKLKLKRKQGSVKFTLEFKPESKGMLMSRRMGDEILIILLTDEHVVLFNPKGSNGNRYVVFPGQYLMEGWNVIKASYYNQQFTLELNENSIQRSLSGEARWPRMNNVLLGYKSYNFNRYSMGAQTRGYSNVRNGFRGEINKFTWNDQLIPFRSPDVTARNIAQD